MPFEDELIPLQRFGYPLPDDDQDDSSNRSTEIPPVPQPRQTNVPLRPTIQTEPQTRSSSDIGRQIVAMGHRETPGFDLQDGRAVWRTDSRTAPKPNIGQRIVGMAQSATPELPVLPNESPEQQGLFSSFAPARALRSVSPYLDKPYYGIGGEEQPILAPIKQSGFSEATYQEQKPKLAPEVHRTGNPLLSNPGSSDYHLPTDPQQLSAFPPKLSAAVGQGRPNRRNDVLAIQQLYNRLVNEGRMITDDADFPQGKKIPESGKFDQATAAAVRDLERRQFYGMSNPAGVITPNGSLFKSMVEGLTNSGSAGRRLSPEMYDIAKAMVPLGASTPQAQKAHAKKGSAVKGNAQSTNVSIQTQDNISKYFPLIVNALEQQHLNDPEMLLMALATIRAESSRFAPVSEDISALNTTPGGHPFDKYDHKNGNRGPGEGELFKGRGFAQLSGRYNYATTGNAIGHPELEKNPEKANDPQMAANILAQFLKDHEREIRQAIRTNNMARARRLVNGGSYGLAALTRAFQTGRRFLARYLQPQ